MTSIEKHANNYLKKTSIFNSIEGWCNQEQFFSLELILAYLDAFSIHGDIIELGVFTGKSAGIFNNYVYANEVLKLIDRDFKYKTVEENVVKLSNGIKTYQSYNMETWCMKAFPAKSAKLIHVDAGHSYNNCWNDIDMSNRVIKDDGIIVIDDFFMDLYPQVTEAVYTYIKDERNNLCLFMEAAHKAYVCRPNYLKRVCEYIISNFGVYTNLTKENYYLNKSSYFSDSNTMSIVPIGNSGITSSYRGLDEDNSLFPSDYGEKYGRRK